MDIQVVNSANLFGTEDLIDVTGSLGQISGEECMCNYWFSNTNTYVPISTGGTGEKTGKKEKP